MARHQPDNDQNANTRPDVPGRPNPARLRRVAQAQRNALAIGTQNLYYKHWKIFADWCYDNCFRALPAHEETVAVYLTERADAGTKVATLGPVLSAIRHYHESVGLTSPTTNPDVQKTKKGLAREYPRPADQVAPIDQGAFDAMIEAAPTPKKHETSHQTATRAAFDKALLSFSIDILARPETTAAAERHHIKETRTGRHVLFIPHSKTDQTHQGVYAFLTERTMEFLEKMFAAKKRKTKPHDKIFGISERQISNRIEAAAKHAGLEGRFRGHSPRVGMAVQLAIEGYSLAQIKHVGRWDSDKTTLTYLRGIIPERNAISLREAENFYDLYDDDGLAAWGEDE